MNAASTTTDPRLAEGLPDQRWPNCRPRDAASLIIVDTEGPAPRVLMGKRHAGHVFMPSVLVFPGGRVDAADHRVATIDDLHPAVEQKLRVDLKGRKTPARTRAFALAAIRETFEESGLLLGTRTDAHLASRSPAWRAFLSHGFAPKLGSLRFVARAITPPRLRRRYDTRFFCVNAVEIAHQSEPLDAELGERHWLTLDDVKRREVAPITRVILEDFFSGVGAAGTPDPNMPVPYYAMRYGRFERTMI